MHYAIFENAFGYCDTDSVSRDFYYDFGHKNDADSPQNYFLLSQFQIVKINS